MVTGAFPMFNTGAVHNDLRWQYKGSGHDEIEVLSIDESTVQSDDQVRNETAFNGIIGDSPALKLALADVERVAPTDSTVLVLGETGTGKDSPCNS